MEFLAITRRRTERFTEAQIAALLPVELDVARGLYTSGAFRDIRSRGDIPGALITVEARDAEQAAEIVATLPLARAEMIDVQIIPVLPYRGFVSA